MGKKGKSTEEVTKKYEKSTTKYGKCTSKVRKSKQKVSEIQYVQFIENKYKKNQLTKRTPQNCILAQQSSLGLAGRRPALA